jgi:hypothetical protein
MAVSPLVLAMMGEGGQGGSGSGGTPFVDPQTMMAMQQIHLPLIRFRRSLAS